MTIYEVWGWDEMASSHGEPYKHSTWLTRQKADAKAAELNANARAWWMTHCSPEGAKNYRDMASVVETGQWVSLTWFMQSMHNAPSARWFGR